MHPGQESCPGEATFAAFSEGRLCPADYDRFAAHLAQCNACREVLVLAYGPGDDVSDNRYALQRAAGRGASGVVYLATDLRLQRRVAIKILRPTAEIDIHRRLAGLRAEARCLAQLSHPNIVEVYEVDLMRDRPFIAMRWVDGRPFTLWAEGRSPSAILAAAASAGRGLVAAHQAGVVHRDVKPTNILVGEDGATMLIDFGLAGRRAAHPTEPSADPAANELSCFAGTPLYLAPEQYSDPKADPRADQYSLCSVVYEALTGRPPFVADDLRTLLERKRRPASGVPLRGRVPRRVAHALLRGLSPDPEARWPSVEALVEHLDRPRMHHARGAVVVGAACLGTALWISLAETDGGPSPAPVPSWTEDLRHDAATRYGAEQAMALDMRIGAYTDLWWASHRRWCSDGASLAPSACACLQTQAALVDAAVGAASLAELPDLSAVSTALDRRADPSRCGALSSGGKPPLRDPVLEEFRSKLEALRILEYAPRQADRARRRGADVLRRAQTLGESQLIAEAMLVDARLAKSRGAYEEASSRSAGAYFAAVAAGVDAVAAEAAIVNIYVLGQLGRLDEARQWGRVAAAWLDRVGDNPYLRGEYWMNLGALESAGRGLWAYERAVTEYRRLGEASVKVTHALLNIAASYRVRNEVDRARDTLEQIRIRLDESPIRDEVSFVSLVCANAAAFAELGDFDAAAPAMGRCAERAEAVFGLRHPRAIEARLSVGKVALQRGQWAEAEGILRRLIERCRPVEGDHPKQLADARNMLGIALSEQGDLDSALQEFRASLAITATLSGAEDTLTADVLSGIGSTLVSLGRPAEAIVELERAVDIARRGHLQHRGSLGILFTNLAAAHEAAGDRHNALVHARKSLAELEKALPPEHPFRAAAASNVEGLEARLSRSSASRRARRGGRRASPPASG